MRYPAFLFAVVAIGVAHADELRVIDGDTFWLNGEKIRLWGIDAPELSDGGIPAKQALQQFIGHRDVTCVPKGKSYDRIVALCTAAGQDIAAWLVRNGYARDWPKYSKGYYADEQTHHPSTPEGED